MTAAAKTGPSAAPITAGTATSGGKLIATLTAEPGSAIIADASILDEIPNGAGLVLLPDGADEEFVEATIALGLDVLRKGHSVYFRWLAPGEWGIGAQPVTTERSTSSAASE